MNAIAMVIMAFVFIAAILITIVQLAHEVPVGFWIFVVVVISAIAFFYVRKRQKDAHPWRL